MKQGRNEMCNCGSGKKFKKCCLTSPKTTEPNTIIKRNQESLSKMKMFGMYYKDNEQSGYCFLTSNLRQPEIYECCMSLYEGCRKLWEFDSQYIQSITDCKPRKEFQKQYLVERTNELEESIKQWNLYQNITVRGGMVDLKWDFSNEKFLDMVSHIMYGIFSLSNMGVIKNDNYNGFVFSHPY